IPWTTLREGLDHLVRLGISVNVASFVGATTLRVHEVGYDDRPPSSDELERMRRLAREAAAEGALGLGSALIYTPGTFAATDELRAPGRDWENLYVAAGGADGILLVSFKSDALKPLTGKTLADVAKIRGRSPEETAMDLVVEDESRVGACYFIASEDNVRRQV